MAALVGAGLRSRSWQANAARMQLAQNTERDGIDFERNRRFTLRSVPRSGHTDTPGSETGVSCCIRGLVSSPDCVTALTGISACCGQYAAGASDLLLE